MTLPEVAAALASYLARQAELEHRELDTLRFGLEIVLGAVVKGAALFALAWLLGLTAPVAVALASGSAFRLLAGGAHCTGFGRCLLLGLAVYLLAGLAGARLGSVLSPDGLLWLLAVGYLVCSLAAWRWAPGAAPDADLGPARRRMFKLLTLLYLQVFLAGAVYLMREGHSSLAVAGLAALVAQGASLTPVGCRLIARYDRWLSEIRSGRRCAADAGEA
ncbi:MAG: accessory gene regulator ArgB-like protein [Desulfotomaculales bacterium]